MEVYQLSNILRDGIRRGDISATFASTYKITTPLPTPYTISYLFEDKAHTYLPDVTGQLLDGSLLIAEAGLEEDKRKERNRAKAEAARKVAQQQGGVYWIGTVRRVGVHGIPTIGRKG